MRSVRQTRHKCSLNDDALSSCPGRFTRVVRAHTRRHGRFVSNTRPGVSNTHPGVSNTRPGVSNTRPDVWQLHTREPRNRGAA
ncbi:hypothetical protein T484DRAFT_1607369 [Baffinella frigidus]|nr:hypothetical protein T484DRAFT_1607369 [Cryptophyta sp. CCMP2293]